MNTSTLSGPMAEGRRAATSQLPMTFLCLHLFFEYLRVHEMLPILGTLRIQTTFLVLFVFVVARQVLRSADRPAPQSRLLLGFLGLALVTSPLATNWFFAFDFAYGIGVTLVGYAAIAYIVRDERDLRTFLAWLVGIHIYLAAKGIRGYSAREFDGSGYTSTGRVGGYFLGDENDVALALMVALPFGMYLFRQAQGVTSRVCWGFGIGAMLVTIVFTFSRGGFVGLVVMALYWTLTGKRKSGVIGAVALAAMLIVAVAPPEYWARIETITRVDEGSAQLRKQYWAAARRMFVDSPIWGVGGRNTGVLMPEYAHEVPVDKRMNEWGRVSHSLYYELLAEFGLVGVVLIGLVLLVNSRNLREIRVLGRKGQCSASIEQLADCLRLSWVGFLVPAAFLSALAYPHLYYLTALTVVVHRLAREGQDSLSLQREPSSLKHRAS